MLTDISFRCADGAFLKPKGPPPATENEYIKFKNVNLWLKWSEQPLHKLQVATRINFIEYIYWITWNTNINYNWHALCESACQYKHIELAKYYYEKSKYHPRPKCDANYDKSKIFEAACTSGSLEIIEYLISKDEIWFSGLTRLCEAGHLHILKNLIDKFHLTDDGLIDLFKAACEGGNLNILLYLMGVGDGLVCWKPNEFDYADFISNAYRGGNMDIVDLCTIKGTDYVSHNPNHDLFCAGEGGNINLIERLIGKGFNNLNSALQGACRGGHMNVVLYLIEKGAQDWNNGFLKATHKDHVEIAKLMVSKGSTVHHFPALIDIKYRSKEMTKYLISLGANNFNGGLEYASGLFSYGPCDCELMEIMVQKGATNVDYVISKLPDDPVRDYLIYLEQKYKK